MSNGTNKYYNILIMVGVTLLIIGGVTTALMAVFAPEWATVFDSIYKLGMFLLIWFIIDKYALVNYDTIEEIFEKQNLSFAVAFAAIIISFALLISK